MKKSQIAKESESLTGEMLRLPEDWEMRVVGFAVDFEGGWGYEMADACVIKTEDYESGINAEYDFAKTRVVIELGRQADSYMVSDMEIIDQALCVQDNKYYDKITFTCTVVPFDHESFFQPNKT